MKESQTELVPATPSTGQLLAKLLESPDAATKIEVIERMVALKEREEARQAEREFAVAFNKLQAALSPVFADSIVPGKTEGSVRYKFAAFEDIMRMARPHLLDNGFSITFNADFRDARVYMTCRLLHVGGHFKDTVSMARVSAPYGASDTQADGATQTYAKRYALCSALNIVIERDTDSNPDARNEGSPITDEQQATLKEMVGDAVKAGLIFDEKVFLRFADAKTYADIGSARYPELFRELNKKLGRS